MNGGGKGSDRYDGNSEATRSIRHRAALVLAARGIRIFPCLNGKDAPEVRDWRNEATTDPDKINDWWGRNPHYDIGIICTSYTVALPNIVESWGRRLDFDIGTFRSSYTKLPPRALAYQQHRFETGDDEEENCAFLSGRVLPDYIARPHREDAERWVRFLQHDITGISGETRSLFHQVALDYAAQGIRIFPCEKDGKPAIQNWENAATTNTDTINKWWDCDPDYNIGMVPEHQGLCVIDIAKHGQITADTLGYIVPTLMVIAPCGRTHVYYKGSLPSTVYKLGNGVATRGRGSYVLLPPSRVKYERYRVHPDSTYVAPLPEYIAIAEPPKRKTRKQPEHAPCATEPGRPSSGPGAV
jgi:hypothetical protein